MPVVHAEPHQWDVTALELALSKIDVHDVQVHIQILDKEKVAHLCSHFRVKVEGKHVYLVGVEDS